MENVLWIILAALFFECQGEDKVMQPSGDVIAAEGDTVTLDCTFETSDRNPYLFWYKQESNGYPKYMLKKLDSGPPYKAPDFEDDRFHTEIQDKSVPLKIQKLQLSDSAVYYCALKDGGLGKLIFGSGTRLSVEPKEEYEPSYYRLQEGDTTVCLATGFSRYNATENHKNYSDEFQATEPARISPDLSLYNKVIFPEDNGDKCEASGPSDPCEDKMTADPVVNGVSFTILALRVIFLKTVVFNILMTMRLWISQ